MADPVNYLGGNNFGPLTPEQQAALDRDRINESLGPFEFMPGSMTALGAGIGGLFALRSLAQIPKEYRYFRGYEGLGRLPAAASAVGEGLLSAGVLTGGAAAGGYAHDLSSQIMNRMDRERLMMQGNPMDAEGQPGGFYGRR